MSVEFSENLTARQITREGGGDGPWVFLINPEPPNRRVSRLRSVLGVKPDEDLWAEFVFYPNRVRMRAIIRRIWKDREFVATAGLLERFISRRKPGYQGTVAIARLQPI